MFKTRNRGRGNKFTFASIILILIVVYLFRMTLPQKETTYPDIIHYGDLRYVYAETVKSSPVMFTRKKPVSEEGYLILARRGTSTHEEIYIYEGNLKYRRYKTLKE